MIRAIDDKIIVDLIKEETKTKSGLILTESTQEAINGELPLKGKIVSIGDGIKGNIEMKVKVGDIIVFSKHAGTVVKDNDDNKYLVMRQGEILAIL